jgi:Bacterial Ig domain
LAAVIFAANAASFAGVNVSAPQNGAVTNSPLHVAATATSDNPAAGIAAIQIYVDGGLAYNGAGATVDTYLNLGAGNHTIVVDAWDTAGGKSSAPVYVVGSGSGVFLSSPGANASVPGSAHVQATAFSPNQITTMQVYDNGQLVNETPGAAVDTTVNLTPGSHYLVVQGWDTAGTPFLNPVIVNVPGAVEASQRATTETAASQGGPQAYVAPNAASKLDIDQMPGWEDCGACAGIGAKGPVVPYSMSEGAQSPSLDGKSAVFWLGGKIPWGSAIWWKQLGGNDGATHFVYDLYFYIGDTSASQALEFDVNQSVGGKKYIFGTECDIRDGNAWRVWDTTNNHWMPSGATCPVNGNSWNHLTWEMERVGTQTHFIAVTMNGYRQTVDKYYYGKPWSGTELNVAFQMDGNFAEQNYQIWLDKVSLYYW